MGVARTLAAAAMALAAGGCSLSLGDGGDDDVEPPADWSACAVPSDCTLTAAGCCDVCGRPGVDDVDAVHRDRLADHFADVCPAPVPCPECATLVNPDLHAACTAGGCAAVDVRDLALTACAVDADCRLRTTGCCECGGTTEPWALIAIAITGEPTYHDVFCDPGQVCPRCAPVYPDSVRAICAPDGHCAVAEAAVPPAATACSPAAE